ncbi:MAG: beta-ketoacyl-[acyl-carrier-protein] synthase family protein [Verrucomicrobiales bacterium]
MPNAISSGQLVGPRRVVVTGAGILTSMGLGWRQNADGFREGRLAFREVTLFDTSRQRVHHAGETLLPPDLPPSSLTKRQRHRIDRASALLVHAAAEAWEQSGWPDLPGEGKKKIPLILGTSAGAMALGEAYYRQASTLPVQRRGQAVRVHQYQIQSQAMLVVTALGIGGPVSIISNACASGANAIGHAFGQIASGRADRALAGGYDALSQLVFAGFDSLQALSASAPRPFDAARDGLALGEGAALVALESLEAAWSRGAEILAEVRGYGAATDVHHLTQPHPEGDAALCSMTRACAMAGLRPRDIDYVNSHGTGTPLNDVAEAHAIRRWCDADGCDPRRIAVSSTKASIGHLLGGAGAVEAVICLMALREGFLPPTTTVREPDPAVCFDLVRAPRQTPVQNALTNSFGFGGANATLVFQRWN